MLTLLVGFVLPVTHESDEQQVSESEGCMDVLEQLAVLQDSLNTAAAELMSAAFAAAHLLT